MMLSRIAESLFWIGRYVERADGTARILDVHLQLLLEDPWVEEDVACRALLAVMGSPAPEDTPVTPADLLVMLGLDKNSPSSIAHSLTNARENARRAREVVSTELWEVLNTTSSKVPTKVAPNKVHEFFAWVRERSALAVGTLESSTSRDEAFSLFTLGRSLERADMTARLLATSALIEAGGPSWTTILRSCGGYEAYLRTYRGMPSAENAAEFLILDRLFPRSVLFSLMRAERCLLDIEPRSDRAGVSDQALRILGQMRSDLEFSPIPRIVKNLTENMDSIQLGVSDVSEAIRARYFPVLQAPVWVREDA
jgi:uncharacterized alpha-E superfamily protein